MKAYISKGLYSIVKDPSSREVLYNEIQGKNIEKYVDKGHSSSEMERGRSGTSSGYKAKTMKYRKKT